MSELNERAKKRDRGLLQIDGDECKGCGLCIEACVPKLIGMGDGLNHFGYRTAFYLGAGCTGCGVCFMVCPEPGAITVFHLVKDCLLYTSSQGRGLSSTACPKRTQGTRPTTAKTAGTQARKARIPLVRAEQSRATRICSAAPNRSEQGAMRTRVAGVMFPC